MCDLADGEWEVFDERSVKARKQHTCVACNDPIQPGHRYVRTFTIHDGNVGGWKHCLRCAAIYSALKESVERDVWVDESLNCGETWESAFGCDPPEELARLAFLTPAEAQVELAK